MYVVWGELSEPRSHDQTYARDQTLHQSDLTGNLTTLRAKRATFIFSRLSIVYFCPFLCIEVNVEHKNTPFYIVTIKGFQVYSTLTSLHKKGLK